MSQHLPEWIDVLDFAEKGRQIDGRIPLVRMDRLTEMLADELGEAVFQLAFRREGQVISIRGWVEADLRLECQCCLKELPWPVRAQVALGVVKTVDVASRLPEELEPLILEADGRLAVLDVVQDELVLAVPPIPQHEQCVTDVPHPKKQTAENPFAVLAQLKTPTPGV